MARKPMKTYEITNAELLRRVEILRSWGMSADENLSLDDVASADDASKCQAAFSHCLVEFPQPGSAEFDAVPEWDIIGRSFENFAEMCASFRHGSNLAAHEFRNRKLTEAATSTASDTGSTRTRTRRK